MKWCKNVGSFGYRETEEFVMDDMIYFFHHNMIKLSAFDKIEQNYVNENEWYILKYFIPEKYH